MDKSIKIIRAELKDADKIFSMDDFILSTPEDIQYLEFWIKNKDVFMLLKDDQLIGYAAISIYNKEEDTKGYIFAIFVSKDYRGCGYGKYLFAHCIKTFGQNGVSEVSLLVRRSNAVARSLYEKYGFSVSQVRESLYPDGEDGMLYVKKIRRLYK